VLEHKESLPGRRRVIMLITPVDDNDSLFAIAQKDIKVLCAVSEHVTLITGCIPAWVPLPENCQVVDLGLKLHYVRQRTPLVLSVISQILKILYIQLRMAAEILRGRRAADVVLCYLGYHFLLPAVVARLSRLKLISGAWGAKTEAITNYGPWLGRGLGLMLEIVYSLSNIIIVQSWTVADKHHYLARRRSKLRLGTQYLGDKKVFRKTVDFSARPLTIGFVGRLSPEKGICNLVEAMPHLIARHRELKLLIIGGGILEPHLRSRIDALGLTEAVVLLGVVPQQRLAHYYNQIRFLIIPSESEGLPNVMLEAISCGAIVISTPVGAIPDIIADEVSGFLTADNSPLSLVETITKAVNHPAPEAIASEAERVLAEKHSYSASRNLFAHILSEICQAG
jgi:glycosyltransferase involved in cell wall biosynthesis